MSDWKCIEYIDWIKCGCPHNTTIETLNLTNCNLSSITTKIGNIPNLHTIQLSSNIITTLPAEIGHLTNLKILDLSYNKLSTLPVEIGNLLNLQELSLMGNQISTIPSAIFNLTSLQYLCISNNTIETIPSDIGNLINITNLHLTDNKITTLPAEIGNLKNLQYFHISNNNIETIPPEIENMRNIYLLYLSYNNLTTIPVEIGNINSLTALYLSHNNLETIPSDIGNLHNLQQLDLSHNNLNTIPAEIGNLQNLRTIIFSENPIEYIPPNIRNILNRQKQAQGIYSDSQSVHNSSIQQTIKSSIIRLISIKPVISSDDVLSSILSDSTLTDFTKQSLVEYSQNTDLISDVNVTFLDVLTSVWNTVITNEHSTDIKHVLNGEMEDAECKCFTGRVSRLVNCLSGFDALVEVKITDNEQIGNVIAVIGERLKEEHRYTVELHKETVIVELKELGYSEDVIYGWVAYIE